MLDDVGDPANYHNRWLPLSEIEKEFVAAYDDFFVKQEYAAAATLAELFPKLFDEDYAVQLAAESNVAWAKQLADAALDGPGETSEVGDQVASALPHRRQTLRTTRRASPSDEGLPRRHLVVGE